MKIQVHLVHGGSGSVQVQPSRRSAMDKQGAYTRVSFVGLCRAVSLLVRKLKTKGNGTHSPDCNLRQGARALKGPS